MSRRPAPEPFARAKGRVPARPSSPPMVLSSTLATFSLSTAPQRPQPPTCRRRLCKSVHLIRKEIRIYLSPSPGPHSFPRCCGIATTYRRPVVFSFDRIDHLAHIVALRKCGLNTLPHFHPSRDVNCSAVFSHRPSILRPHVSLSTPDAGHTCLEDARFFAARRTCHVPPTVPYPCFACLCSNATRWLLFGVRTSTGEKLP